MHLNARLLGRSLLPLLALALLAFAGLPVAFLWAGVPAPYAQMAYLIVAVLTGYLVRWSFAPLIGRRPAFVAALMVAALPVLFGILATVNIYFPGALEMPPSESERAVRIAQLEAQVQERLGTDLEYVEVKYGRDGHKPAYFGTFALKGIPLRFSFQVWQSGLEEAGIDQDPLFQQQYLGGSDRFVKLARRYHSDFPEEPSMSYSQIADASYFNEQVGRDIADLPGPLVIVEDSNQYWSDELAQALGLYSWNDSRQDWDLIYRGELEF